MSTSLPLIQQLHIVSVQVGIGLYVRPFVLWKLTTSFVIWNPSPSVMMSMNYIGAYKIIIIAV